MPEPPVAPKRWHEQWAWRTVIVVTLIALVVVWRAGTFDHALYNVGLNAKPCGRNGFGAVFCGQELTEYNERISRGKQEGEAAATKVREAGAERERDLKGEQAQKVVKERGELESKMAAEKAIYQREPEGSAASDLAKAEYEGDRAQLQQLNVRSP